MASYSREVKKVIIRAMEKSSENLTGIDFQLHDFGFRGVVSGAIIDYLKNILLFNE